MRRLPAPSAVLMPPVAIPRPNARNQSVVIPSAAKPIAAVRSRNVAILSVVKPIVAVRSRNAAILSAVKPIVAVQNLNVAPMPAVAICHLLPVLAMNTPVARKDLMVMNMLAASRAATWAVLRPTINHVAAIRRANSIPISVASARHNISARVPAARRCTFLKVLAVASKASVVPAAANTPWVALIAVKVLR